MASQPPTNFTTISRDGAGGKSPFNTASTWGIPLPDACGENRRTSQAAIATAAADTPTTTSRPANDPV